ncbi:GSCOCG00012269001-RA-CDS, partial [Cotesia congregata]
MAATKRRSSIESKPDRIYNDYSYHYGRVAPGGRFLICSKRSSLNCNAQGFLDLEGNFTLLRDRNEDDEPVNPHCHAPEKKLTEDAIFQREMHKLVVHSFLSNNKIYDSLKDLYPNAAENSPYPEITPRMRQWRKTRKFPDLADGDLTKFIDLITNDDQWKVAKRHDEGSMTFRTSVKNNQVKAVTFADSEFLELIKPSLYKVVYIEESPITLNDIEESHIILGTTSHKNYAFPILWSVMNDCSQENYSAVIRNGLANFLGDNQPETIYYNFDEKIFYALRNRYATTRIKGTFEAYCNLLFAKTAQETEIRQNNDEHLVRIFSKLILLSLLPPHLIISTFYEVVQNMSPDHYRTFKPVLEYYLEEFIKKVGVSNFTFHNDVDAITNCSKRHSTRLKNSNRSKTKLWNFLGSTMAIQVQNSKDITKLIQKKSTAGSSASRVDSLIDIQKIQRLNNLLDKNEITPLGFLSKGVAVIDQFVADLIVNNPGVKVNFQVADLVPIHHKLIAKIDEIREIEPEAPGILLTGEDIRENDDGEDDNVHVGLEILEEELIEQYHDNEVAEEDNAFEAPNEANVIVGDINERIEVAEEENGVGMINDDVVFVEVTTLDGKRYFKSSDVCCVCRDEDSPVDIIYNPCRHCLFCQGCQKNYVDKVYGEKEIF